MIKYIEGVFDTLLVVFVILKLCGIITWSWILVLSPLMGALILGIAIGIYKGLSEIKEIKKEIKENNYARPK